MPYMLNTDELNWGAKMGFFWAGLCGICAVYTYFRVPEPRGRTYGASSLSLALEQLHPSRHLHPSRRLFLTPSTPLSQASSTSSSTTASRRASLRRRRSTSSRSRTPRTAAATRPTRARRSTSSAPSEPKRRRAREGREREVGARSEEEVRARRRGGGKWSRFVRSHNLVVRIPFRVSHCSDTPSLESLRSSLQA